MTHDLERPLPIDLEAKSLSLGVGFTAIAILLLVGGLGWWLAMRKPLELDPTSIERIPKQLAGWLGEDLPLARSVEAMLRADSNVQRVYRNADGELVWLYVGYYGTERGGRPEHTPWVCYPSAGWMIRSNSELPLVDPHGALAAGKMNELVVDQAGHSQLVRFWYATHRNLGVASENALTFDHLIGRFSRSGRADGALVRVSTPVVGNQIEAARARLEAFSTRLVPEVTAHWPTVQ